MDQAKEVPKILILRKEGTEPTGEPWVRLAKAMKGISEPHEELTSSVLGPDEISAKAEGYTQVFLDLSLVDFAAFGSKTVPGLTLVKPESFAWHTPASRALMLPVLSRHSCLLLEDLQPKDLIRLLHLYLLPKRLAGVTPLLEKGSVIVGEKVQSLDNVGTLLDKLSAFVEKIEGFTLANRLSDLRQTLGAVITKAFAHAGEATSIHPTVDFQVGLNQNKIVVNLRFPKGNLDLPSALSQAIDGRDLFWQQIWLCSDQTLLTQHAQYNELEIMLVISRPQRPALTNFRTILTKLSDRSLKKDNLLTGPTNFDFHLLSNVRLRENETLSLGINQDSGEIDFGSLPEPVVKKLSRLAEENAFQKEQQNKVTAQLRDAQIKTAQFAKELSQKKGEIVRVAKAAETQQETFRAKMAEVEKQIEHLKAAKSHQAAVADPSIANQLQEAVTKLEASLKAIENEKNQMAERFANEQKKVAIFEQKYSTLYKDLANKDKEIGDLKTIVVKLRKESTTAAAATATAAKEPSSEASNTKIKDLEAREAAFKQELRKLMFKIENHEKNVKVIQADAAEKAKMMEQKLQGAKTKELELLKRIEELSNALKKSAKAA